MNRNIRTAAEVIEDRMEVQEETLEEATAWTREAMDLHKFEAEQAVLIVKENQEVS